MVPATHPLLSFFDQAVLSGACSVVGSHLGLDGTLEASSDSLFTQKMAGVASQSVSSILEIRENLSSADGQSEFHSPPLDP